MNNLIHRINDLLYSIPYNDANRLIVINAALGMCSAYVPDNRVEGMLDELRELSSGDKSCPV